MSKLIDGRFKIYIVNVSLPATDESVKYVIHEKALCCRAEDEVIDASTPLWLDTYNNLHIQTDTNLTVIANGRWGVYTLKTEREDENATSDKAA